MSRCNVSRRTAAAVIGTAQLSLLGASLGTSVRARAQTAPDPADPELLARLTLPDRGAFRTTVRRLKVEVVRVLAFDRPTGPVTALVLIRRSAFNALKQDPSARIELVAEPPNSLIDTPAVGKGNRFANPHALPQGQGILREIR